MSVPTSSGFSMADVFVGTHRDDGSRYVALRLNDDHDLVQCFDLETSHAAKRLRRDCTLTPIASLEDAEQERCLDVLQRGLAEQQRASLERRAPRRSAPKPITYASSATVPVPARPSRVTPVTPEHVMAVREWHLGVKGLASTPLFQKLIRSADGSITRYVRWCIEPGCRHTIDSHVSQWRCRHCGYFVCVSCGGCSCARAVRPLTLAELAQRPRRVLQGWQGYRGLA